MKKTEILDDNQEHLKKKSFLRKISAFSSATLISRVLGYIRDALVAATFGGGLQTDAFYAAFKVPNLLRRFLGEGALTGAFVPVFSDVLHKEGKEEAEKFFHALVSGLMVILSVIVIAGIIFAPQVTQLFSWGFTQDPDKFELTVQLTRLTFPFLLVISLAALVTAVLNSTGLFFVPAVAPSGLSIGEIAFISVLAGRMVEPIYGLAVSAVVGGGIHLVWQLPYLYRQGYRIKWVRPFAHPRVRSVFLLMIPTIIGLCADQVNAFVDQFCASFLQDGSITALYNSNRLMQMPLAIFGVAAASVALPALSKAASSGDDADFKDHISTSIRIANFILIPSFIGLAILGFPITQALFEHGLFTRQYSWMTYTALLPFAAGLPAFSGTKILATAFFAKKDTQTPMRVAFWSMGVNVVLDVLLMWRWEVAGLAFATTSAAWFQFICLFFLLRKKIGRIDGRAMFKSFLFASIAGVGMGIISGLAAFWLMASVNVVLRVFASITLGIAFYFFAAKILKVKEFEYVWNTLRRKYKPA